MSSAVHSYYQSENRLSGNLKKLFLTVIISLPFQLWCGAMIIAQTTFYKCLYLLIDIQQTTMTCSSTTAGQL